MKIKFSKENPLTDKDKEKLTELLCSAGYIVTPYPNMVELRQNEEFDW